MSRYTGPKARICRREGMNVFGSEKYQKILQNRPGTPGIHGVSMRKKPTAYGSQLREKQKVRFMFGVTERQLRNYFKKAASLTGDTGEQFMSLLERRLDNAIYRAGFTKTRMQSRQLVTHGHVLVNDKKASTPSISLKLGDKITIKESTRKNPMFDKSEDKKHLPPKWLKSNRKDLSISIEAIPEKEDFEKMIESHLIVEFYSR
jgi:small subunit ribosomal protein S4